MTHIFMLLFLLLAQPILALIASPEIVIAMAGNKGFAFKMVAVVEKVRSMKKGRSYKIIGYDLGFDDEEKALLSCTTPTLLSELRPFPFEKFPKHVKKLGCYAWKPLLLRELWTELGGHNGSVAIIWLDTAVGFNGPSPQTAKDDFFERAVATAREHGGVLSDRTQGKLAQWVHRGMFSYFEKVYGWDQSRFEDHGFTNCNGAFSVWVSDYNNQSSVRNRAQVVMHEWANCAMKQECVCPGGSNRGNHRQDQAALTLVNGMHGLRCDGPEPGSRQSSCSNPKHCRWAVTHRTRPICKDPPCVAKKHKPACLGSFEK